VPARTRLNLLLPCLLLTACSQVLGYGDITFGEGDGPVDGSVLPDSSQGGSDAQAPDSSLDGASDGASGAGGSVSDGSAEDGSVAEGGETDGGETDGAGGGDGAVGDDSGTGGGGAAGSSGAGGAAGSSGSSGADGGVPVTCNDAVCGAGEDCYNCAADCPCGANTYCTFASPPGAWVCK